MYGSSETESLGLTDTDSEEEAEEDGDWASAEESEGEAADCWDKGQQTISAAHPLEQQVSEERVEASTSATFSAGDGAQVQLLQLFDIPSRGGGGIRYV